MRMMAPEQNRRGNSSMNNEPALASGIEPAGENRAGETGYAANFRLKGGSGGGLSEQRAEASSIHDAASNHVCARLR
jgi:hypothetical protein